MTTYPADTIWYLPRGDAAARIASFTGYSKNLSGPFEERAYELASFLKAQTEASATGLPTRLHYDVPLEYAGGAGAFVTTVIAAEGSFFQWAFPTTPAGKKRAVSLCVARHNDIPSLSDIGDADPDPGDAPVPSATEIINAPGATWWSSTNLSFGYDLENPVVGGVYGPKASQLEPGTKYWAVLLPTFVNADGSGTPVCVLGASKTDKTGRIAAFWTNRRPRKPTIAYPPTGLVLSEGDTFGIGLAPSADPDTVPSKPDTYSNRGLTGAQVQYAPVPSPASPNPEWRDLPIKTTGGMTPAWFIDGSPGAPMLPPELLSNTTLVTMAGWDSSDANRVFLGGGNIGEGSSNAALVAHDSWVQTSTAIPVSASPQQFTVGMKLAGWFVYNQGGAFDKTVNHEVKVTYLNANDGEISSSVVSSGNLTQGGAATIQTVVSAPANTATIRLRLTAKEATWSDSNGGPYTSTSSHPPAFMAGVYFALPSVKRVGQMLSGDPGQVKRLLTNGSITVKVAEEPSDAYVGLHGPTGVLPAGVWRLRARVMDAGNPWTYSESGTYPLNGDPNNPLRVSPSVYPESNTSDWSNPVTITAQSSLLPPLPLSPVEGLALPVPVGSEKLTFMWQFRSASIPPKEQASYTVRFRKRGSAHWITASSASDSTFHEADADDATFEEGEWEWQVSVVDTDEKDSGWSEVAYFWIVPPPKSGDVIPAPGATLDGGTLGCGTYRVFVYRRGGFTRVGELKGLSKLEWNRVRDDISTATISVADWDIDCGSLLASLQTWAYELVIYRDNGYSVDRVWEGPITLLTYAHDEVTIQAKDMMGYAYRRILRQRLADSGAGDTVVGRATRALQSAFAPEDPRILAYMRPIRNSNDARQWRVTPAYSRTVFEEVDDLAANAGLDYTCIGRSILLWGTKNRIGSLPELTDRDLGAAPIVSEYGMSTSNFYVVSDGNGAYGTADRFGGDSLQTYGRVEILASTWTADSTTSPSADFSQEGVEKVKESYSKFAERAIADRFPPPMVVRVPDNTSLNPDTPITIQQLVPGVAVPLRSEATLRTVKATQKLDSVKVTVQGGKEVVSIVLSSFSRDDASMGGGEET